MAFLGRETAGDVERAARYKAWVHARTPYALLSVAAGLLSIVDFFTIVLGVPLALLAIGAGAYGLREIGRRPELLGRRLCIAGIVMGGVGLVLTSLFLALVVWR